MSECNPHLRYFDVLNGRTTQQLRNRTRLESRDFQMSKTQPEVECQDSTHMKTVISFAVPYYFFFLYSIILRELNKRDTLR